MVFEIGVNLRVTECLDRGDRNYMEDFSKCYFERVDGSIVFGFFGIFDGHGGSEAAAFAKKYLVNEIKKIDQFWSENDDDVLMAIKKGFYNTHQSMWNERDKWAKTVSGFDSTAGTTATVAIVRNRKLYIGHVGDSACVLAHSKLIAARIDLWEPICLTIEHKPGNINERKRIEKLGGTLAKKAGVQRVVWNRPKVVQNNSKALSNISETMNIEGNRSISTSGNQSHTEGDAPPQIEYEQVPFLAVTRSLGDLWSYDQFAGVYHISPEPDVQCIQLDSSEHRCIILGSDGLWNVVPASAAVEIVRVCERETERRVFLDPTVNSNFFYNPAASLVRYAISQWKRKQVRADNVSALVVMIDPPGPSMTKRRDERRKANFNSLDLNSIFSNKVTSYDLFSKALSKEFLIECSRWRSANESKDEGAENQLLVGSTISQTNKDKDVSNDHSILSNPSPTISKSTTLISKKSSGIIQEYPIIKKLITESYLAEFCIEWYNNNSICNYLYDYFNLKHLTSENDIMSFIKDLNQNLVKEILHILPWIYTAKFSFKRYPQIHASLTKIPLFCDFWLDLHARFIKPLERTCPNIQFNNMQAIITILRPNILTLLKQHNYWFNENVELKSQKIVNQMKNARKQSRSSDKSILDNSSITTSTIGSTNRTLNCGINSNSLMRINRFCQLENRSKLNIKKYQQLQRSHSEKFMEINDIIKSTGRKLSPNHNNPSETDIVSRLSEINGNYRQYRRSQHSSSQFIQSPNNPGCFIKQHNNMSNSIIGPSTIPNNNTTKSISDSPYLSRRRKPTTITITPTTIITKTKTNITNNSSKSISDDIINKRPITPPNLNRSNNNKLNRQNNNHVDKTNDRSKRYKHSIIQLLLKRTLNSNN